MWYWGCWLRMHERTDLIGQFWKNFFKQELIGKLWSNQKWGCKTYCRGLYSTAETSKVRFVTWDPRLGQWKGEPWFLNFIICWSINFCKSLQCISIRKINLSNNLSSSNKVALSITSGKQFFQRDTRPTQVRSLLWRRSRQQDSSIANKTTLNFHPLWRQL